MMPYILAGVTFVVFAMLISALIGRVPKKKRAASRTSAGTQRPIAVCPVCGSSLYMGEKITTYVFRASGAQGELCAVAGCPRCYPKPAPGIRRVCKKCRREIDPRDGFLTARVYYGQGGRKTFAITGCSRCTRGFPKFR